MKYLKDFHNHSLYEAYLIGSEFPETINKKVVSYCKHQRDIHYDKYIPHYNVLDILYANAVGEKKVDSTVLDPSLGYTPIGICIAETGFFGENELARFVSLKHMSYDTPETGTLTTQGIRFGNYGKNISTINDISYTHNNGHSYDYFDVDYYDSSSESYKIPSVFDANNEWNTSVLGAVNQYAATDIDGKNKTNLILETATVQSMWQTDISIINESGEGYAPAACCCARYHTLGTHPGDWYLGAAGEMCMILVQKTILNTKLSQIAAVYPTYSISSFYDNSYWTSTEYNSNNMFRVLCRNALVSYYGRKGDDVTTIAMIQY